MFCRAGWERFITERLKTGICDSCGEWRYHGEFNGRPVFSSVTTPPPSFFKSHRDDDAVLIYLDYQIDTPDWWKGLPVSFCELFKIDPDQLKIIFSIDTFKRTFPKPKSTEPRFAPRKVIPTRKALFSFALNKLSEPFCRSDFKNGEVKPEVVRTWMEKNCAGEPPSTKTIRRHLVAIGYRKCKTTKKIPGKYDQSEPCLCGLLSRMSDPMFTDLAERSAYTKQVSDALAAYNKTADIEKDACPIDIGKAVWVNVQGDINGRKTQEVIDPRPRPGDYLNLDARRPLSA